jgi:hypothetical protein
VAEKERAYRPTAVVTGCTPDLSIALPPNPMGALRSSSLSAVFVSVCRELAGAFAVRRYYLSSD